jgi:hypothetical protein
MFKSIAEAVARELSGERAKNHVIEIHRSDRYSSFDRYRETAEYCAEQMRNLGLDEVEKLPCRADGRTPYGDWLVPRSWDARSAELRIVETGHVLARYPDVPASLFMYSGPTSPEGFETELIWVDDIARIPDAYEGKIIFTGSVDKEGRKALAVRGIAGIVCDRGKLEFPDLRGWDNYTFAPRNEEGLFGFSLSFREAEYLREQLRKDGTVKVCATVDTHLYDGELDNVTGIIPGTEGDEEVLLLGHIYEQGANDNASGAGAGLEVFRTLKTLIDRGVLPRPRRSMRILLGFECCGLMGYVVENPEVMGRTAAAINPDMVGEDVELCGTSFSLHLTPGAAPSCVDALAVRLFEELVASQDPLFRWREKGYSICDSFVADPTIGVPSVSIIGIPDRFYHSSLDTPDKVSAKTLDQTGLVLATYIYLLADAGPETAGWLAEEAASRGRRVIAREGERFIREALAGDADEALAKGKKRLPFLAEQQNVAVASALRFGRDEKVVSKVKRLQEGLGRSVVDALFDLAETAVERVGELQKREEPAPGEIEKKAEGMVPKRSVVGPLTLEPLLLKEEGPFRWAPSWCAPHNDVLIWADGKRSILEICKCAHLESGRRIDLEEIVEFFEFLAEKGYVEWCAAEGDETGGEG